MRNPMRALTLALAGLLCLAPLALAQPALPGVLSGNGAAAAGPLSGAADHSADVGAYHAAAQAAAEDATADATADLTHSELGSEGFWAWLALRLDALVRQLSGMLGQDVAAHGGADVKVGDQGLDASASLGDVTVDGAASASAPDAQATAGEASGKVQETRAAAEGLVPHAG